MVALRRLRSSRLVAGLLFAAAAFAQGAPHDPLTALAGPQTRVLLLYFVASDCPVSNRYFPELRRIESAAAARGVRTWYIYPNAGESADAVRQHQRQFSADPEEARLDPTGELARLTGAHTTPEAAIAVRAGGGFRVVYTGRIDDRYVHIGLERPAATRHDLQQALDAALEGRAVPAAGGPAVGCAIVPPGTAAAMDMRR